MKKTSSQNKPPLSLRPKIIALSEGLVDMTGQRFGRLVAIEYAGSRGKEKTGAWWKCKCDCGGEKVVPRKHLVRGTTKSCGCLASQKPDRLLGRRYGSLVVVEYAGKSREPRCGSMWNCKCDCGGSRQVSSYNLRKGCTGSCGCAGHTNAASAPRVHVENVKLTDAVPKFRACEPGVYFLFEGTEIVYIGQSRNVFERLGHHERRRSIPFDGWDFVSMDDPSIRYGVEQELIRQHSPRYNREAPPSARAA